MSAPDTPTIKPLGIGRKRRKPFRVSEAVEGGARGALDDDSSATYVPIRLDLIDTDPEQARMMDWLDTDTPAIDPSDPDAADKQDVLDELRLLGESIKKNGLLQPVALIPQGPRYRLLWGERRVRASRLVGLKDIRAEIRSEAPSGLRLKQYSENSQRRGLSLYERAVSTRMVMEEAAHEGVPVHGPLDLRDLMSVSDASAYRYWALGTLNEQLLEAVEKGYITSLIELYTLTKKSEQEQALEVERLRALAAGEVVKPAKKRPGFRRPSAAEPAIKITAKYSERHARRLMTLIVGQEVLDTVYRRVDWSDRDAALQVLGGVISSWMERDLEGLGDE